MKLDSQQSVPNTPLRVLYLSYAVRAVVQLPQGWYKLSVSNYYGYDTIVVIRPGDASFPNSTPYGTPGFDHSSQGRTASTTESLRFYCDDSGKQWRLETYGQYATLAYLERIPAPTDETVKL